MKKILFISLLLSVFSLYGQENSTKSTGVQNHIDSLQDFANMIDSLDKVVRETTLRIEDDLKRIEDDLKSQQIKKIAGIPFGMPLSEARSILINKFGEPVFCPEQKNVLSFKNVKYSGIDFGSVNFLFQSDGYQSYFNCCVFCIDGKTKKEAEENQKMLSDILSKKYKIYSGGIQQGGGISPLWDGTFANLRDEHYIGFHTDIIEYSAELANSIGVRYGTRLIYGPFNYVNEEF